MAERVVVLTGHGVEVTRFVGPVALGADRTRYQLSVVRPEGYAILDYDDLLDLYNGLGAEVLWRSRKAYRERTRGR